jgi:hypothetical protein
MMPAHIQLKLFAALTPLSPENSDRVPVIAGHLRHKNYWNAWTFPSPKPI